MKNRKEKKKQRIRKEIEKICIPRKNRIAKIAKEYSIIALGTIIMAMGIALFLLPNELSTGGFSGIGTIFYYVFNISLGITMFLLNIPLLIISFFKISKELSFRSVIGTVLLAIFVDIFDKINPLTNDKFLACIYGGVLVGIGTALILKMNASTGGSDLLSYVIRIYKPQYRSGNLILAIDVIIIILNVIVFNTIEIGLYSAIAIYLMGKMIDIIFEGANFTKAIFIISPKFNEIAEAISEKVNRGSTGLYSKGMYTNEEKLTLLCVGSRNEAYAIQKEAKSIDRNAFIIIINAREVLGKGFKKSEEIGK